MAPRAPELPAEDAPGMQAAHPGGLAADPPAGQLAEQRILAELRRLRGEVEGIDGSIVATSDGLLVTHDLPGADPAQIAALIATTLGLARQATVLTGRGDLQEAVIRGKAGYLATFAVGSNAVLAVLGSSELNIGLVHYQTRGVVKRIAGDAAGLRGFNAAMLPAGQRPPGASARSAPGPRRLPGCLLRALPQLPGLSGDALVPAGEGLPEPRADSAFFAESLGGLPGSGASRAHLDGAGALKVGDDAPEPGDVLQIAGPRGRARAARGSVTADGARPREPAGDEADGALREE